MNLKWKVGDTTITKITEIIYPEFDLIPAATPAVAVCDIHRRLSDLPLGRHVLDLILSKSRI